VLSVKEKGTEKTPMSFTFIDAVARYGREMVEEDFEEAYRRAGRAFQGRLQQNFVVLRDWDSKPVANQGASSTPRKRQREEEMKCQDQKRGTRGGMG
jgi:hypothetical protein